jgi:hypothetical protein
MDRGFSQVAILVLVHGTQIVTNHMIPSNRPDELAALLLELAG